MEQNKNNFINDENKNILWPSNANNISDAANTKVSEKDNDNILAGINPDQMRQIMNESGLDIFMRDADGNNDNLFDNDNGSQEEDMTNIMDNKETDSFSPPNFSPLDEKHTSYNDKLNIEPDMSDTSEEPIITISKSKFELIIKLIENINEMSKRVSELLNGQVSVGDADEIFNLLRQESEEIDMNPALQQNGKVVEGVFNGQYMIGPDGKQYSIPSNYASKSKLVEGDILKLTISDVGKFIYKQIGPIERSRIVGNLAQYNAEFFVEREDKKWKILTASVTYFKGKIGDEAIILVPKHGDSTWAAVENIITKS